MRPWLGGSRRVGIRSSRHRFEVFSLILSLVLSLGLGLEFQVSGLEECYTVDEDGGGGGGGGGERSGYALWRYRDG
jgi:hypothetical protein